MPNGLLAGLGEADVTEFRNFQKTFADQFKERVNEITKMCDDWAAKHQKQVEEIINERKRRRVEEDKPDPQNDQAGKEGGGAGAAINAPDAGAANGGKEIVAAGAVADAALDPLERKFRDARKAKDDERKSLAASPCG